MVLVGRVWGCGGVGVLVIVGMGGVGACGRGVVGWVSGWVVSGTAAAELGM